MGWIRAGLASLMVVVVIGLGAPAGAQDGPDTEPTGVTIDDAGVEAQPESSVVRDDDTSSTVRRIRRDLLIVAGLTTAALVVYVWHTSPTRRLRIASARVGVGAEPDDDGESLTRVDT